MQVHVIAVPTNIIVPIKKEPISISHPSTIMTPIVAMIVDKSLRAVSFSFKMIAENITINAGVSEVTKEPVWASDNFVPIN